MGSAESEMAATGMIPEYNDIVRYEGAPPPPYSEIQQPTEVPSSYGAVASEGAQLAVVGRRDWHLSTTAAAIDSTTWQYVNGSFEDNYERRCKNMYQACAAGSIGGAISRLQDDSSRGGYTINAEEAQAEVLSWGSAQ